MRFLLTVIAVDEGLATTAEMSAIDAFNEGLRSNGHWVMAAGIEPPSAGFRVDNRGADPLVSSGSLGDSGEFMAGFWIIDATTRDEALELGLAASRACNRTVEVRAFLG